MFHNDVLLKDWFTGLFNASPGKRFPAYKEGDAAGRGLAGLSGNRGGGATLGSGQEALNGKGQG
ncbi:hypothetical protein A3731_18555 [Roseovarius sp. HI0049]|nr:hypothetical protein A3731_18555 [Roseovarius sp. HI0049]